MNEKEQNLLSQAGIFLGMSLQNVDESRLQELNQGLSNVSKDRLAEIRKAIDKQAVKMEIPIGYTGYQQITEEQQNCPYCHKEKGSLTPRFLECNYDRACAWIELDDKVITFDNTDGDFTNGEFKIDYCPKCGRKLET
jgi:hypothetical protein